MRLGLHLSIAMGFPGLLDRALFLRCGCVQFFVGNPRQWRRKAMVDADAKRFRNRCAALGISPVVVHLSYLPNLAAPDSAMRCRSIEALRAQWKDAARLGADYLVIHPGHHRGMGIEAGIRTCSRSLRKFWSSVKGLPGPRVLLENAAGQGSEIGARFGELRAIMDLAGPWACRMGYCIDTAHAFAAGYAFRTRRDLMETVLEMERLLGRDRLKLIHLNDSRMPRASRIDRHWHVGLGAIGRDAFRRFVRHPLFQDLPAILETPQKCPGDDMRNMERARTL